MTMMKLNGSGGAASSSSAGGGGSSVNPRRSQHQRHQKLNNGTTSSAMATTTLLPSASSCCPHHATGGTAADDKHYYDEDDNNKYRKKKKRKNRTAGTSLLQFHGLKTYYTYLGLLVFGGLMLGRWIGSRRRHTSALQHKARAEALWNKVRFQQDAPHAHAANAAGEVDPNTAAEEGGGGGGEGGFRGGQQQGQQQSHSIKHLEQMFERQQRAGRSGSAGLDQVLDAWLAQVDSDIVNNVAGGTRWIRPYLLPSIEGDDDVRQSRRIYDRSDKSRFLKVKRLKTTTMAWQDEWKAMAKEGKDRTGPVVDYTDPNKYTYPDLVDEAPPPTSEEYPPLRPLKDLMLDWNHDIDNEGVIEERLMHFDYQDPKQLEVARKFREAELPFKLTNVPELLAANQKWTDAYVGEKFNRRGGSPGGSLFSWNGNNQEMPLADGLAQESPNNYFAFFTPKRWDVDRMGLPPTRNSDWDFETFSQHARYADAISLKPDQPHFYWQSGVDREERYQDQSQWTFISRDLPSFSSPTETFFVFNPDEQKGIQCRFGERGVVAATHYDAGRNCVGMITGAKRYILSPPRECSRLGIFTSRKSSIYRHSLLNFAHISHLYEDEKKAEGMSDEERHWLERAGRARSVETVLKAGEVLYIPSHWFHYIISLQKSAQCNVRSGIDYEGHPVFGNRASVEQCRDYE